jgi:hypothetical protein
MHMDITCRTATLTLIGPFAIAVVESRGVARSAPVLQLREPAIMPPLNWIRTAHQKLVKILGLGTVSKDSNVVGGSTRLLQSTRAISCL